MPTKRGRPSRAGTAACERIEIRVTPAELADIRALARLNQSSVSDIVRLAVLAFAHDGGQELPAIVLGGVLQECAIVQRL